jgi:DNA-binding CsgD family transcriptional regulator
VTEYCDACGQPLPKQATESLPERELIALSAWWATGHYRDAATLAGVAEQTLKNQLHRARIRNGVHSTVEVAQMYLGQLRSLSQLTASHNSRVAAKRRAA